MNATSSTQSGKGGTLNGWEEIASEVNRSVRTVQRWERKLHLPVHRLGNARGAPVFIFRKELQLWWVETAAKNQEQVAPKFKTGIVESIEKFLSRRLPIKSNKRCSDCGSKTQKFDVHFWMQGSENGWKVSLPFCPTCEPELSKHSSNN
jgi:hypothetical protein